MELLHLAQSTTESQWATCKDALSTSLPVSLHVPRWPIKLAALKGQFLSDMISRYLNLYIRLGSSDFSEESIRNMSAEIGAQQ